MSLAPALVLRDGDRQRLAELARLPSVPSGLAKRARIVLLAADGMPNAQIARTAGVSRPTAIGWRDRYVQGGIAALEDEPGGRQAVIDEIDVVVATLENDGRPPARLGISHWSPGSWRPSWASRSRRWRGSGASGISSHTGSRGSSSRLTRSWSSRSATSSGFTSTHPPTRSWCRWTRKARSRRWTGPRRCCRCGRACRPGEL